MKGKYLEVFLGDVESETEELFSVEVVAHLVLAVVLKDGGYSLQSHLGVDDDWNSDTIDRTRNIFPVLECVRALVDQGVKNL